MKTDRVFMGAFAAGMAAPASLYDPPGRYLSAAAIPNTAQSFAFVGSTLMTLMGSVKDDGSTARKAREPAKG